MNRNRLPNVKIYRLNPLADERWDELVACRPCASVFHERGWLEALAQTYGYEPFVLTTAAPGETLRDGIAFCRVSSWLTGPRWVSLPFSDHCEPLLGPEIEFQQIINWMQTECDRHSWNYIELRPLSTLDSAGCGLRPNSTYWFHELSLTCSSMEIFRRLHNNSFRRNVQKAQRERLSYEVGRSEQLLEEFYRLQLITRRRHQLLPQPRAWFKNLLLCMGDKLQIRVARKNNVPIAAMLTLQHKESVVYKYGCSDERYHSMGGIPFLFWKLIEESKTSGAKRIDLGRTDLHNPGLIAFKDRLGASRRLLTYYRLTKQRKRVVAPHWGSRKLRRLVSLLPEAVSCAAGRVLYRHIG